MRSGWGDGAPARPLRLVSEAVGEVFLDAHDPRFSELTVNRPRGVRYVVVGERLRFEPEHGGCSVRLTPAQARKVAAVLVRAAEGAEQEEE